MSKLAPSKLRDRERAGGRRIAAGELALFSLHSLPCPHVPEPRLLRPLYLLSPLFLSLSCTFLSLSLHPWGALFLCIWSSLFLPWVCVLLLLSISAFLLSVSLLCLFVLILVSLLLFLPLSVCVSLFLCMSLSFSMYLFSLSPPCFPPPLSPSLYISAPFSPSLSPLLPARCSLSLACPHRRRFRGTCAERLSWGTFDGLER